MSASFPALSDRARNLRIREQKLPRRALTKAAGGIGRRRLWRLTPGAQPVERAAGRLLCGATKPLLRGRRAHLGRQGLSTARKSDTQDNLVFSPLAPRWIPRLPHAVGISPAGSASHHWMRRPLRPKPRNRRGSTRYLLRGVEFSLALSGTLLSCREGRHDPTRTEDARGSTDNRQNAGEDRESSDRGT